LINKQLSRSTIFSVFLLASPANRRNLSAKHYLAIALTVLFGLLLLWLLFPRDDGTLAEIRRRGTLRVGLDASFPPFESMDAEGNIIGLDVDLAQAIATDLGVELELVNIGFDGLYDALLARRVDLIISGLPYDAHWTEDVAYTHNYFNAGQVLVIFGNESTISDIAALKGQSVAVEWGSQADMEVRQLSKTLAEITIIRRATADEALAAVAEGQAAAAIVDGVSGISATSQGFQLVTYLSDEWYTAAVHIESRELLESVNQSLARLQESGQMDILQERWLQKQ
jgi:polar amino acid transport system substrate-binding protein